MYFKSPSDDKAVSYGIVKHIHILFVEFCFPNVYIYAYTHLGMFVCMCVVCVPVVCVVCVWCVPIVCMCVYVVIGGVYSECSSGSHQSCGEDWPLPK